MKLFKILEGIDFEIIQGSDEVEINSIQYNSKKVTKGDLFFCIKGFATDGHNYAAAAQENGAAAVICEEDIKVYDNVTVIKVKDSRKAMALASANYYGRPADKLKLIGVTGTNGKTTSTFMLKTILEEAGHKVGLIGTILNYVAGEKLHAERTTPESLELQQLFAYMVEKGVEYCIMEVSSHSLELDRVYGVPFKYGVFTNLTQDHLDFHKTFENYYNAKLKLFKICSTSVINIDDTYGEKVYRDASNNKLTYGIEKAADFRAEYIAMHSRGAKYTLINKQDKHEISIFIPGRYNIYNSLCAAAVCLTEGIDPESVKRGLEKVQVPGRCELTAREYNLGFDIILDYAHSPDGLDNILRTVREFTKGRLISVYGCGGNRDKTKRPIMGEIGARLSDIAIITSDNPRDEEPMDIIKDILAGITTDNYMVVENRKEAIRLAIDIAREGDVIVIAGKGHEDYQIFKNKTIIHFDEREVVREILENRTN
ncbi:UDP-N-acetylmuramoyl-L-alanyl-D-glutamate--2,6-diaminopimelate ligase [Clostridium thermarum]|uniref:UDP-N-acetylmuramoyl-L-alanyl-D-glutamate--2, 6-diaminopimelate ligase n=1 Tax=Clostridium thermarum TaxID=1716543 RepID=UPI001121C199|nr:UDP-N-acetylmuramoyl-L-alanyl-D-glutamate--2,6-diaminopimelate ligase [Clostridium thermarum]